MKPQISIVIPCYNGGNVIGRQLDSLLMQAADCSFEVVVANNRSTDNTQEVLDAYAKRDSRVRSVSAPDRAGINHARNAGCRSALGEFVVLVDADDFTHPGFVQAYSQAFNLGGELLGGRLRFVSDAGQLIKVQDEPFRYFGPSPWPAGANCGFRRDIFDRVGDFNEEYLGGGDETEFFWRAQAAGYAFTQVNDATIDYVQRSGVKATLKQRFSYGRSEVQLFDQFGSPTMSQPQFGRSSAGVVLGALQLGVSLAARKDPSIPAARLGRNLGRIAGAFSYKQPRYL